MNVLHVLRYTPCYTTCYTTCYTKDIIFLSNSKHIWGNFWGSHMLSKAALVRESRQGQGGRHGNVWNQLFASTDGVNSVNMSWFWWFCDSYDSPGFGLMLTGRTETVWVLVCAGRSGWFVCVIVMRPVVGFAGVRVHWKFVQWICWDPTCNLDVGRLRNKAFSMFSLFQYYQRV